MKKVIVLSSIIGVVIALGSFSFAYAQTASGNGQALEIGPTVIALTADPGETINASISIRDISNETLLVKSQLNDFVAADEQGTPKLLLDETEESPYSLKKWIEPFEDMILESKEKKDLNVTIHVPNDASPGGYYGTVRFSSTPPNIKETGVSLSASIATLILVKVNGEANESLSLEELSIKKNNEKGTFFETTPLDFSVRIKNNGNVHLAPSGKLQIKDMFGKVVADVFINQPPKNVLPGSIREYIGLLDKSVIGDKVLFGKYTADLTLTYGADAKEITSSITFWVIPYKLMLGGALALVLLFLLLRIGIKKYNQHIVELAQQRSNGHHNHKK